MCEMRLWSRGPGPAHRPVQQSIHDSNKPNTYHLLTLVREAPGHPLGPPLGKWRERRKTKEVTGKWIFRLHCPCRLSTLLMQFKVIVSSICIPVPCIYVSAIPTHSTVLHCIQKLSRVARELRKHNPKSQGGWGGLLLPLSRIYKTTKNLS